MVRTSRPLVERMTLVWHDWFATSNEGVGSQNLMLAPERALPPPLRSARSSSLLLAVTRDPAMLLWLNGTENEKGSPNENYARELMELFTLGAGRGYTERDVREQARALTGFAQRLEATASARPTSASTASATTPARSASSASAGASTGRTPASSASSTARTRPSSSASSGATSSRRRRRAATQRALEQLYVRDRYAVRPVVEAILRHPAPLRRARAWSSRRSSTPPACCAPPAGRSTPTPGRGSARSPASSSSTRRTSPAGTTSAGSTPPPTSPAGRLAGRIAPRPAALDPEDRLAARRRQARRPRARVLGRPDRSARHTRGAPARVRASARSATADQSWKQTQYPALTENALRQLIAASPDLQTS